jgi:hypothetical protein
MTMESSYTIKQFHGGDADFEQYKALVLATWLRALRHGNPFFRDADAKTYWAIYSKVIMALLRRPECLIRIAVLTDEPDVVIGWSAVENSVLHFVFVKHQGRRRGIARSLIPGNVTVITHLTKTGRSLWQKKLPKAIFNPF